MLPRAAPERRPRDRARASGICRGDTCPVCAGRQAGARTLLDEYCRTTGCDRKAAIRRLRTPPHPAGARPAAPVGTPRGSWPRSLSGRGWPVISSPGSCCAPSSRCATALVTHHGLRVAPAVSTALTTASAATLDRLLRPLRRRRPRQPWARRPGPHAPAGPGPPAHVARVDWRGPGRAARRPRLALRRAAPASPATRRTGPSCSSSADSSPPWWLTSIRSMTSEYPDDRLILGVKGSIERVRAHPVSAALHSRQFARRRSGARCSSRCRPGLGWTPVARSSGIPIGGSSRRSAWCSTNSCSSAACARC